MNVLIIGSGGREHALAWKLSQSTLYGRVWACPGNPGIAQLATCVTPTRAGVTGFLGAAETVGADLTVVGPEAPLVDGIVDAFRANGLAIVGPTSKAARIEGSKAFAKAFMQRWRIPTAESETAETAGEAIKHIDRFGYPVVLKADGLAAGKGVIIAVDRGDAERALARLPPGRVVVEQYLDGEEVSFIVYTDGNTTWPLAPTQDHKRVGDSDTGANTGGMGAYCDSRILERDVTGEIIQSIIEPTLEGMKADGHPYTGFLYAGLMLTEEGPKVLEFNARLGDPETQALMQAMESDLGALLTEGEPPRWRTGASVCVVLAAAGYPGTVRTGDLIEGAENCGATVFHAGTRMTDRGLATSGGRVMGVTSSGATLQEAIGHTYAAVAKIHFDGMHYRCDIGRKGLKRW